LHVAALVKKEQTMKKALKWVSVLPAALPLVMLFVSCGGGTGEYKIIDFKLHGTWESTDTGMYSGTLVINVDTITITGYAESQTPWYGGDDTKRPFRDFAKGVPFPCYADDGKLFIKTGGGEKSVPYFYIPNGQDKFLTFTFGGREEALKRTGN
jgi:hypothetical protein